MAPQFGGQLAGRLEHAVDTKGTDRHDIGVEHQVRQAAIALQGIAVVEGEDLGLLPILQSSQKSRGMRPLCRLGVPSRRLPRSNWLRASPSPRSKGQTGSSVRPAQWLMNWTTASRMSWGTQAPFRVPQALFF
jgi:hypothetical protein